MKLLNYDVYRAILMLYLLLFKNKNNKNNEKAWSKDIIKKSSNMRFSKITDLFLYGPCPDNYSETTTLFLKRKEINKKPVAMLAYVLCKTEGRRIKNKI